MIHWAWDQTGLSLFQANSLGQMLGGVPFAQVSVSLLLVAGQWELSQELVEELGLPCLSSAGQGFISLNSDPGQGTAQF